MASATSAAREVARGLVQLDELRAKIALPSALAEILATTPIIGIRLWLTPDSDLSGMGGGMQWMTTQQMLDEAANAYPGIVAASRGYVPVAICLQGSGDPYFYRCSDGAVVRIPHDAATESHLDESAVETVSSSVEALVLSAELDRGDV